MAVIVPVFFALLLSSTLAGAEPGHRCTADAVGKARALLMFHTGATSDLGVDETATVQKPMRNPANPQQLFDVLEVAGYVRRAEYRMRLIYARVPGTCVLMGQEIIERSSL